MNDRVGRVDIEDAENLRRSTPAYPDEVARGITRQPPGDLFPKLVNDPKRVTTLEDPLHRGDPSG